MYAHINKIFAEYHDKNIELEFRIKYDFNNDINSIRKIVDFQKKKNKVKFKIIKTINCIKNIKEENLNLIYQVEFLNKGAKKIITTSSKKKLGKPIFNIINNVNIKISLSEEKDVDIFPAESCDIIRIKNRLSISQPYFFNLDYNLNNWRLDITLIKTLPYVEEFNLDDLKQYVTRILPVDIDTDNYFDKVKSIIVQNKLKFKNDNSEIIEVELEYIGKKKPTNKAIDDCIKFISLIPFNTEKKPENNLYKNLLSRVAKWIQPHNINNYISGKFGIKELATQVISLDIFQAHYILIPNINNYFISPKIDGDRSILIFDHDKDEYFSLGHYAKEINLLDFGCIDNKIKKGGDLSSNKCETILDSEYYESSESYYIFDIISYKGESLYDKDYKQRIKYIDKILDDFSGCNKLIKKPIFEFKNSWKSNFKKLLDKKWEFETDGWIFTPSETKDKIKADYIHGKAFKWKPIDVLSIDFLIKNGNLYSGMRKNINEKIFSKYSWNEKYNEYGPVIFTPTYLPLCQKSNNFNISKFKSDYKYDNKIIELIWKNGSWKILRIRKDRQVEVDRGNYFGNNHKVAELIWHSIFWPMNSTHFLKSGMINYQKKSKIVNNNKIYFYKFYSFLLNKIKNNDNFTLVDCGIIYPLFSFIVKLGIYDIDFVVSDGFSCLNIIKSKYNKRFINEPDKHIKIRAFKPSDYDISIDTENLNRVYIAILPTKEQIKHIKHMIKNKNKNKIEIYIVIGINMINTFGKLFSIKKISDVFKFDLNIDSDVKKLYLLHYKKFKY